eukprot:1159081-Pelagomonas_calceolata.AAC.8
MAAWSPRNHTHHAAEEHKEQAQLGKCVTAIPFEGLNFRWTSSLTHPVPTKRPNFTHTRAYEVSCNKKTKQCRWQRTTDTAHPPAKHDTHAHRRPELGTCCDDPETAKWIAKEDLTAPTYQPNMTHAHNRPDTAFKGVWIAQRSTMCPLYVISTKKQARPACHTSSLLSSACACKYERSGFVMVGSYGLLSQCGPFTQVDVGGVHRIRI